MDKFENITSAIPLPVHRSDDGAIYRYTIKVRNDGGEFLIDYWIEDIHTAELVATLIENQGYADGLEQERIGER
ncbi:hypothetical protein [Larsenimonas rhizosphaerae]|uniref:Uncharacterized protein n=1 Tax=Larsenimonas rhizosphaerae TaxID=2944682 RepID=A0AA41ZLD6_9GAMM|nr:hypothetical protein [Larsenimonas rhizosphaerae]MCX2522915.1 hypothetical protein [Larsenimonas rhizosphaerae]